MQIERRAPEFVDPSKAPEKWADSAVTMAHLLEGNLKTISGANLNDVVISEGKYDGVDAMQIDIGIGLNAFIDMYNPKISQDYTTIIGRFVVLSLESAFLVQFDDAEVEYIYDPELRELQFRTILYPNLDGEDMSFSRGQRISPQSGRAVLSIFGE